MAASGSKTDRLSERDRVALRFAEVMTLDSHKVDNQHWSSLKQYFDDGEIIELASVIGLFNYFNRFNNALQVEITK